MPMMHVVSTKCFFAALYGIPAVIRHDNMIDFYPCMLILYILVYYAAYTQVHDRIGVQSNQTGSWFGYNTLLLVVNLPQNYYFGAGTLMVLTREVKVTTEDLFYEQEVVFVVNSCTDSAW